MTIRAYNYLATSLNLDLWTEPHETREKVRCSKYVCLRWPVSRPRYVRNQFMPSFRVSSYYIIIALACEFMTEPRLTFTLLPIWSVSKVNIWPWCQVICFTSESRWGVSNGLLCFPWGTFCWPHCRQLERTTLSPTSQVYDSKFRVATMHSTSCGVFCTISSAAEPMEGKSRVKARGFLRLADFFDLEHTVTSGCW
jgi:hypothetical protein